MRLVYKPVYKEVHDAVSVATILLAGQKVPPALLNGTATDSADTSIRAGVAAVGHMVNASNMESTVVADKFDTASAVSALAGASVCSAAGIE